MPMGDDAGAAMGDEREPLNGAAMVTLLDEPRRLVGVLEGRMLDVFASPGLIGQSDVTLCEQVLATDGLPAEAYQRALSLLVVVIYWRADLVSADIVASLAAHVVRALPPSPSTG